jgi:hypothetical protein
VINHRLALRIVPIFLLVATAFAEGDRVCMAGNVEHLSDTELRACQTLVHHVRDTAARYHTPSWHFIVVCDESGWKDYAAFSTTPARILENASADTDLALHTTFLRGSRLQPTLGDAVLTSEMTTIVRETAEEIASNR